MLHLAEGVALGLSAALSPGPFQAYAIAEALRRGAPRALPIALAPLASDGPIIALVLVAMARAPEGLLRVLQIAGGAFLVWLAARVLRSARRAGSAGAEPAERGRGFVRGVLVNALGPGPWIFWGTVGGPILVRAWRESPRFGATFLIGFYLLLCGSMAALIVLFATARRLGARLARPLAATSGAILLAFGIWQIWRAV